MQIINRNLKSTITDIKEELSCQASFNSDGNLTLRHYNPYKKDTDTIIVLSGTETRAIFRLMGQIKKNFKADDLPF